MTGANVLTAQTARDAFSPLRAAFHHRRIIIDDDDDDDDGGSRNQISGVPNIRGHGAATRESVKSLNLNSKSFSLLIELFKSSRLDLVVELMACSRRSYNIVLNLLFYDVGISRLRVDLKKK